ncbi:MAG TPA: DUF2019 domain-containing protein [Afipia sp.]
MRSADLSQFTVEQLLGRFVALCLQDERAMKLAQVSVRNRLVVEISDITKELKKRPGDQRGALIGLFDHPNLQVRYHVATNLMNMIPERALREMNSIADSKIYPIAGCAGTYLVMQELAAKEISQNNKS